MTPQELRQRLDRFADDIISLGRTLDAERASRQIASQLHDAGTSVAANYRAACRAQSRAAFIAKLSVALEESDEALFWLHRLSNQGFGDRAVVEKLFQEANEITAILNASRKTARG
jgi:four helix bundle protein